MRNSRTMRTEKFSPSEEIVAAMAGTALAVAHSHVLVVEDDEDCGMGISLWLEGVGHAVTTVRDGAEAIRWIEENEPALTLLDLGLPGMHGLKVLHEIRMRGLTTQVVVLTAVSGHGTAAQAKAMGAREVLRKPVERSHLLAVIDDLLPEPDEASWSLRVGKPYSRRLEDLDDPYGVADLLMSWARGRCSNDPEVQ